MNRYEVVVGNIGVAHLGSDEREARRVFAHYVEQSKSGRGRAGGETVALIEDNSIVLEHVGEREEFR